MLLKIESLAASTFDMFTVSDLLMQVVVAIAIGGLIGLERERDSSRKFAGLRTLALLCGAGPIVVYTSEVAGSSLLVAIYWFLAVILAFTIAYIRFSLERDDIGLTTSVTVFLVALVGTLIGQNLLFEGISIGIVVAFLLAEKERLHTYVDKLSHRELLDSMKLLALIFILYPILPTEPVDPYGVVNLREVLVFAIFVLTIEFSSYVSMRQFGGSKGLMVTGLLAGGANSFATAGIMARMANQSRQALDSAASGLLLATVSMIVRNVGIASVLAVSVFWTLWKPTLVMLCVAVAISYLLWSRGETSDGFDIDIDSPFSFATSIKFSAVYMVILVMSAVTEELFGGVGLYLTAFAGGLVSSAAVAVSAATVFNNGTASIELAGGMVLLGILASLMSKIILVGIINRDMWSRTILPMAFVGLVGLLVFLV